MTHRFVVSVVMLLTVVFLAAPAAGQNKCDAGKIKCIRQKLGCLLKVHEVSQKKGLAPDGAKLQRCVDKFDGGADPAKGCFAKLEAAAGANCSTTGDVVLIEKRVDQDVEDYLTALSVTVPTLPTTTTTSSAPTTTTNPASLACGDPGDTFCGGSCPAPGTCVQKISGACECTTSECELVEDASCVGNCGQSGGTCACDGGVCVSGRCPCPAGYFCESSTNVCVGPECTVTSDCLGLGGCFCPGGGCLCQ